MGFLLSRALGSSVTAQENVVIQTTAVATGTMALAAGFVGIIPALGLLNVSQDGTPPIRLSWAAALAWSFAVAYYGFVLLPHSCLHASDYRHPGSSCLHPLENKSYVFVPTMSAFQMSILDRLSKKGLLSPRGPLLLSLFLSYTNSHHQRSQMETQRNIPHLSQTRNTPRNPI